MEKVAFELSLGRWMEFLQRVGVGVLTGHRGILGKERAWTKAFMMYLKDPFMNHGGITYTPSILKMQNFVIMGYFQWMRKVFQSELGQNWILIILKYKYSLVIGEKVYRSIIVNIPIPLHYTPVPNSFT